MGSAIVNLGQTSTYTVRNESQCAVFERNFTRFTENPLPPFRVTPYVKLFMQALNFLDEAFRKRHEKEHRVYLGDSTVSFLLHEPSQSLQSPRNYSSETTTPYASDGEEEALLLRLRNLPRCADGSGTP